MAQMGWFGHPNKAKEPKKKEKKKGLWGLALRGGQISFALAL
jgi:hypothetical protein